jgi:hypothetical protein
MKNVQQSIDEARLIIESFDPSKAMTVGFDEETYTLTAEQMAKIALSLYLADCAIADSTVAVEQLMKLAELYQDRAHEVEKISIELLRCPWWNFVKLIKLEKQIHQAVLRYHSEPAFDETFNKLKSIFQK